MCPSMFEGLEARRLLSRPPTVSVQDVWVDEGNDGTGTAQVVVGLSQSHRQAVTVNYATQNGSALAGTDYVPVSGKLTFAAGETIKTIQVPVIGDRVLGSDQYFLVNLQGTKNAKIVDGQGIVTIRDDEPRLWVGDAYAVEGNSGTTAFNFNVYLSAPYDLPVTVNYSTQDGSATAGSDYAASSGAVTFAAGETSQTITVLVNGDGLVEPSEGFLLNLSTPNSYAELTRNVATGTIADDEPGISIYDAVNYYGDMSPLVFYVYLSAPSEDVVTVDFTTEDYTAIAGTDYAAAAGTLTFAPGETVQTIVVDVLSPEFADKYFLVRLSGAVNAPLFNEQAYGYWYYDYGYYDGGGYYDYYGYGY